MLPDAKVGPSRRTGGQDAPSCFYPRQGCPPQPQPWVPSPTVTLALPLGTVVPLPRPVHACPEAAAGGHLRQVVIRGAWGPVRPVGLVREGRAIGFQGRLFIVPKEGLHDHRLWTRRSHVSPDPDPASSSPPHACHLFVAAAPGLLPQLTCLPPSCLHRSLGNISKISFIRIIYQNRLCCQEISPGLQIPYGHRCAAWGLHGVSGPDTAAVVRAL